MRDETAGALSRLHAVMQTAMRKLETSNGDVGSADTDAALVDAVGEVEVVLRALLARLDAQSTLLADMQAALDEARQRD